jgi:hypothetical protein
MSRRFVRTGLVNRINYRINQPGPLIVNREGAVKSAPEARRPTCCPGKSAPSEQRWSPWRIFIPSDSDLALGRGAFFVLVGSFKPTHTNICMGTGMLV